MNANPPGAHDAPLVCQLRQDYTKALLDYLVRPSDPTLCRAHELGRRAIAEGLGVIEMAAVHHEALTTVFLATLSAGETEGLHTPSQTQPLRALFRMLRELAPEESAWTVRAAKDFFAESLMPFEDSYHTFREANPALHRQNELLEAQAKRVAHALHDETGQILACIHFALEKLAGDLKPTQEAGLQEVRNLLDQMETKLARLSHELRPTILDDLGLPPAVEFLARWVWTLTGIPITVEAATAGRLLPSVETVLYRTVQEALSNVAKHARASHASVRLEQQARMIRCSIRDDGVGFDAPTVWTKSRKRGLGLLATQERLNAVGGTLQIQSAPGQGTEVLATIPLEDTEAA